MVKVEDDDADGCSLDDGLFRKNVGSSSSNPPLGSTLVKEENLSRSHSGDLKSYFIGMGFSSVLVDKVIEENRNGDSDANLLLEALINYSKLSPKASDSWEGDCDFGKDDDGLPIEFTSDCKQESEEFHGPSNAELDKRSYLAMMDFSEGEINMAIGRLGVDASLSELVDFIVNAQTGGFSKEKMYVSVDSDSEDIEESTTATLFGTMDRTLCLLQMGFTENEVSSAIDKFGPEVPVNVLAEFIVASRMAFNVNKMEDLWDDATDGTGQNQNKIGPQYHATGNLPKHGHPTSDAWTTKASSSGYARNKASSSNDEWITKAKASSSSSEEWITKTKESSSNGAQFDCEDVKTVKKAKYLSTMEGNIASSSNHVRRARQDDWEPDYEAKPEYHYEQQKCEQGKSVKEELPFSRTPNLRSNNGSLSRPPYFFYVNVLDVSQGTWKKLSQFLYTTEPEFTNTQFFSALIRKEGYLHNLPTDRRFHVVPKPPMSIEDALPHTKKWWPSWDTRKQLHCINSEATGMVQLCERLTKMIVESQGFLSKEQQIDIIHQCKRLNLIWVGRHKLRPIEPEQVESILGYPSEHTEIWGHQPTDRLAALKYSLQTDTIAYHLSVLKNMYPDGLRVLSIFSGIGGAEIALHRLGIRLKCVVSVEASEMNRKILKRWWQNTGQTGALKQIGGIEKLTSQTLEGYMNQFGGFDIIIGSNPGDFARGISRDISADMDINLYFEFVRVFQRVRSIMARNS